jgi:MSHA biogenesis protein MshG
MLLLAKNSILMDVGIAALGAAGIVGLALAIYFLGAGVYSGRFTTIAAFVGYFAATFIRIGAVVGLVVGAAALHPALGVVVFVVLLMMAILGFFRRRWFEQQEMLRLLGVALNHQLPLVRVFRELAKLQSRWISGKTNQLADRLEAGWPLAQAVAQRPTPFPGYAVEAIQAGAATGEYGQLFRQAIEQRQRLRPAGRLLTSRLAWFVVNIFIAFAFAMLIMPQMVRIFVVFGVSGPWGSTQIGNLPGATLVQEIGKQFIAWGLMAFVFLGQLGGFIYIALIAAAMLSLVYISLRLLGSRFPLTGRGRISRKMRQCRVLNYLAAAFEHQTPLPTLFQSLMQKHGWLDYKRPFLLAAKALDQGEAWPLALVRAGLVTQGDLPLLQSANRAGNLPEVCRELAALHEGRLVFRLNALSQLISLFVTMSVGALVLCVAVSLFHPLSQVIHHLAK